ncbi:transmembrane protein, partial [Perilla frutescens var. frutescens]
MLYIHLSLVIDAERLCRTFFCRILKKNSSMYHFSIFHASHHIAPVPATETEIEAEAHAVEAASKSIYPIHIVLDRIILTPTGVLLGCWQVVSGADPVTIRAKLKDALSRAPQKQL